MWVFKVSLKNQHGPANLAVHKKIDVLILEPVLFEISSLCDKEFHFHEANDFQVVTGLMCFGFLLLSL